MFKSTLVSSPHHQPLTTPNPALFQSLSLSSIASTILPPSDLIDNPPPSPTHDRSSSLSDAPQPRRRTDEFIRRSRSASLRSLRRKSWDVDDLRLPLNLLSSVADVSREMTVGPSSGFEREDADRERERINSARYPFAKSAQLLRRFGSHEGLNELDDDDDEDRQTDDDFSSEDESFKGPRRPASVSSLNSQRSSKYRIRIEDQSQRQTNAFASDAWIRAFYAVGVKSSGYVVFLCEVKTKEGPTLRVPKRYSEFVRLRNDLIKTFPKFVIPNLPHKSSLAKFRPSFLERRRKHLSWWLTSILMHCEMGGSGVVRAWILE